MVRAEAEAKNVLNLFAYTGTFSVYAADGGAATTTTVDLSQNYLEWAQRNMELNGFKSKAHRYVCADAMDFLSEHTRAARYDVVVVDPPTFSNSKKLDRDWDVQRDHVELLNSLVPLMRPRGVIFFSTNM